MRIGIDGSRAFIKNRTGIEEYSYQVIKNLRSELGENQASLPVRQVVLYIRKNQLIDFNLPKNWKVKTINWPFFWTQFGLSLEMLLNPVDVLFVPAHTVPMIHPKKTVVTVHGLEYEFCPQAYSWFARTYMRLTIKKSCQWAEKIISVSENTKKDLINLYKVDEKKISVIYEGFSTEHGTWNMEQEKIKDIPCSMLHDLCSMRYLLFIGRIEERKNIGNIIKAFEILKEKYNVPHKLVLAGKPGFGYQNVKSQMSKVKCAKDIIELGFVSEEEKWALLKKAEVFVFPTLYEGFGIPILEAQSVGCPVVASRNSSIPEVVGSSALLVDPQSPEEIAESIFELSSNKRLKDDIINRGLENKEKFHWDKCSKEISELFLK